MNDKSALKPAIFLHSAHLKCHQRGVLSHFKFIKFTPLNITLHRPTFLVTIMITVSFVKVLDYYTPGEKHNTSATRGRCNSVILYMNGDVSTVRDVT